MLQPVEHPIVQKLRPLIEKLDNADVKTRLAAAQNAAKKSGVEPADFQIASVKAHPSELPWGVAGVEKVLARHIAAGIWVPAYSIMLRGELEIPTKQTAEAIRKQAGAKGKANVTGLGGRMWLVQAGSGNSASIAVGNNVSAISAETSESALSTLNHWLLQNEKHVEPISLEVYGDRRGKGFFVVAPEHVREYLDLLRFVHELADLPRSSRVLQDVKRCLYFRDRKTLLSLNRLLEARAEELGVAPRQALQDKTTQKYLQAIARSLGRHRLALEERLKAERKIPWHET